MQSILLVTITPAFLWKHHLLDAVASDVGVSAVVVFEQTRTGSIWFVASDRLSINLGTVSVWRLYFCAYDAHGVTVLIRHKFRSNDGT